jgi:hypothetical protein
MFLTTAVHVKGSCTCKRQFLLSTISKPIAKCAYQQRWHLLLHLRDDESVITEDVDEVAISNRHDRRHCVSHFEPAHFFPEMIAHIARRDASPVLLNQL